MLVCCCVCVGVCVAVCVAVCVVCGPDDRPFAGPPSAGPPKISRFFFLLTPPFSFFFSLSGGPFVEFWWCFGQPGPSNVLVFALGLSCETPA